MGEPAIGTDFYFDDVERDAALLRLGNRYGVRVSSIISGRPIYRSRELYGLDEEDQTALGILGIGNVFDLRKSLEREQRPDTKITGVHLHELSVDLQDDATGTHLTFAQDIEKSYGKPGQRMNYLYSLMADHGPAIGHVMHEVDECKGPVLLHCANGKDRVGVVCACIMKRAGFPWRVILMDYLRTNEVNAKMNKEDLARLASYKDAASLEILQAMFQAREEYLRTFFDGIDAAYGSFDRFVKTCCL